MFRINKNGPKCIGRAKNGKRCRNYPIEGYELCKKCNEGLGSAFIQRSTSDSNAYMKDLQRHLLKKLNLPYYTVEDEKKKQEIWGYKKGYCFDTGAPSGARDHIYGIRERSRKACIRERSLDSGGLQNIMGIDEDWNRVSCTQHVNTHWKTENVPNGKNLVYDNFTQEEINKFPEKVLERYNKFIKWKEYCISRGVDKLYIEIPPGMDEEISEILRQAKIELFEKLNNKFCNYEPNTSDFHSQL